MNKMGRIIDVVCTIKKEDNSLKSANEDTSGSYNKNDQIPFYFVKCKIEENSKYRRYSLVETHLEGTGKSVKSGTNGENPHSENAAEGKDRRTSPRNKKKGLRWKLDRTRIPHKSINEEENVYDDEKPKSYETLLEKIEQLECNFDDDRTDGITEDITFLGITINELKSSFRNKSSEMYRNRNYFLEELPKESPSHKSNSGSENLQRKSAIVNYKRNSAGEEIPEKCIKQKFLEKTAAYNFIILHETTLCSCSRLKTILHRLGMCIRQKIL
ncbi:hypothetical protein C922_01458 [Plasmodium inui San Antonio 1]|uniref:Uncharacterized protein n=1 Tax=Plasmodium inui San Antonio 1 TaxID=1237626 RepID=W7AQW7_9APIC|nr:hypothetical protein C922_01458 [Plasmodium inui San Antonio 1]EUD67846.1 hypothetical protein C922_01458 [Plasmodium inui San Antonio 1]